MQNGSPALAAHRTKLVKQRLREEHIPILEWPGNSPDLNPIENAWNLMKNKVQETKRCAETLVGYHGNRIFLKIGRFNVSVTAKCHSSQRLCDLVLDI